MSSLHAVRRRKPTRRQATPAILFACALTTVGCQTSHVNQVGGPRQHEQGNQPSTEDRHKTLHAFVWGAVRQNLPVDTSPQHVFKGFAKRYPEAVSI